MTAHLSMKGYESDRKKIFLAQKEGWIVLEVTSGMIHREELVGFMLPFFHLPKE